MNRIHPSSSVAIPIVASRELAQAPQLVVRFGVAPDGLPWHLRVDRSRELAKLFRAVCEVFGVRQREELPLRVLGAVENHVASGLMGIHTIELDSESGAREVYVSRRAIRDLLGPTLLSQVIASTASPSSPRTALSSLPAIDDDAEAVSTVAAIAASQGDEALASAVEQAIVDGRSSRRLLVPLVEAGPLSGAVNDDVRVLRAPRGPFRPLIEERMTALGAVEAVVRSNLPPARVPLADADALGEAIRRVQQDRYGGTVEFEAPRAGILAGLAEIAAGLEGLHASERVHADLSPGNVLFTADAPVIFDSLDVVAGSPATTATFSWAAPEQIIGHPLDPRADVFALGKLATRILGGVPFGEQTHYVVPVGGSAARTVELLKCEGVFVDVSGGARSRPWQIAWQEFLGRCLAYDRTRRPESGRAFADGLRELLEAYPPTGGISFAGSFGQIVEVEQGGARGSARLCAD